MEKNDDNPPAKEQPDENGKRIQAEAQSDTEPFDASEASLPELRKASEDLKTRIAEAKRHNDLPVDSALGSPAWERSVADGRLDQPEEDDDK
jgi:hypothetical protein